MSEQALYLSSDSLLSKWGFGDGDLPDDLSDWLDARGIEPPSGDRWREILCRIVRDRLLPVLDQRVEVMTLITIHNPIRAETVDGVDVSEHHYDLDPPVRLTPEFVSVPFVQILPLFGHPIPEDAA